MSTDNPRLPFELQESILSHLAGSLDSESYRPILASCTLVCHAWRSIVQPWILTELVIGSDLIKMDNIAKFFGAASPSHHLSKHIKSISMAPSYTNAFLSLSTMLRAMDEREMFRLFNNIEYIDIDLTLVQDGLSEEGITLLSQLRQLRKMQIMYATTQTVSFDYLVSSFPALTHLGLCDVHFSYSGSAHVRALKLQRLGVYLLNDRSPTLPPGMRLDAPELVYLTLERGSDLSDRCAASFMQNVITSFPLENLKALNLIGHTWNPADVISGKSWHPSTTHSARVLMT
jgi:hypothetical protein